MIGVGARASALEITRLTRWPAESRVARGLGLAFVFGALLLLFAPWQQNAKGTGRVIAFSPNERALVIEAPVEGQVVNWRHIEGDWVEKGEIIVELQDNDPRAVAHYRVQREAAAEQIEAADARVEALADRVTDLVATRRRSLEAAAARIAAAKEKAEATFRSRSAARAKARTAETQETRKRRLFVKGLVSERDLEVAERDAAEARADALAAQAKLTAAQAETRALQAERAKIARELAAKIAEARGKLAKARKQQSEAISKLAAAKRALARQDALLVRAPGTGMLTTVLAGEEAAFVKKGEPLGEVVPNADVRAVELFVRGNDAPLVVPGQRVQLQFEGWPAIQFGGWPGAAVGTFAGEVAFVGAQATNAGRFRVVAVPEENASWPDDEVLRQGNRVNGWILLETVPLGYELWRQLNGFPPDLPPAAAKASGVAKGKVKATAK